MLRFRTQLGLAHGLTMLHVHLTENERWKLAVMDAATKPIAIGIPWYTRASYAEILEMMEDSETFPKSFEDWCEKAQATERKVESEGTAAVRALIDPEDFFLWCKSHGLRMNGLARGKFASEVAFAAIKHAH